MLKLELLDTKPGMLLLALKWLFSLETTESMISSHLLHLMLKLILTIAIAIIN